MRRRFTALWRQQVASSQRRISRMPLFRSDFGVSLLPLCIHTALHFVCECALASVHFRFQRHVVQNGANATTIIGTVLFLRQTPLFSLRSCRAEAAYKARCTGILEAPGRQKYYQQARQSVRKRACDDRRESGGCRGHGCYGHRWIAHDAGFRRCGPVRWRGWRRGRGQSKPFQGVQLGSLTPG